MDFSAIIVLLILVGVIFMIRRILELTSPVHLQDDPIARKRNAYSTALNELRNDPTNPNLHEKALMAGRIYSAATREGKGVTLFDETALANDIRAVTANASQTTTINNTSSVLTLDERINALKKMKESGLLSDEEFEQKRKNILDSI